MNANNYIYVSTDIETNGPHISKNSILSIASVALEANGNIISTFTINLELLPDGEENPVTMQWWQSHQAAWEAARENCIDPTLGMAQYVQWLKQLPGQPVFVAYPVAFDFSFVVYYLERFTGENPFKFFAIDLRSLAMGLQQTGFASAAKSHWPKHWVEDKPHTHIALDDAIEQGTAFCNMLGEFKG